MMKLFHYFIHLLLLLFLLGFYKCYGKNSSSSSSGVAILVFGDSTVDPGNNNYVNTFFKSNFPPYGRDFQNHIPTGRFSNGLLVTDFVASYVGVKETLPPYLDPTVTVQELMTGVSFASAGTGLDPLTSSEAGVIPISTQVGYLKEYKNKIEAAIGKEKTGKLINDAVFVISIGTNDVVSYFTFPVRHLHYTLPDYYQFLLQRGQQLIQNLWEEGARNFAIAGLPPLGCLPMVIKLDSTTPISHGCIDEYSIDAVDYNEMLQNELQRIQNKGSGRFFYLDIYGPMRDMIQSPQKFGFEDVRVGCCGGGLLEMAFLCNSMSPTCSDASKFVFWDSIHPTERAYFTLFQSLKPIMNEIFNI